MFENLVETEIIQEAETLKLLQEQQKKLDQREGREWLKFVQIARGIYLATKNHEYITIETIHQALLYTSDNKDLIVTHDHNISLSSVIRIYEKQYRYQRKILGLKTKFIPNGYKLLVSLSCDFWGARAIPLSIDKVPMIIEEMPAIVQTMQILANVIDDHEAKLNALLSKLEAVVLSPAVSPNGPSTGNEKDRSTSSPLNRS